MNSSAMPRSAARCGSGFSPLVSRIDEDCGCSTTGSLAKIDRDAASPCTRAAMFTVWPK